MSTTNLFVESMVIGVGAAGWMGLLVLSFLPYDPVFLGTLTKSSVLVLPALASVYLLGIIMDRLADGLLERLRVKAKRVKHQVDDKQHYDGRNLDPLVTTPS